MKTSVCLVLIIQTIIQTTVPGYLKRPFSGQQVVAGVNSNSTATTAKSITAKQVITINTETFIDVLLLQMGFRYDGNIYAVSDEFS